MKKFISSLAFIAVFGIYAVYQNSSVQSQSVASTAGSTSAVSKPATVKAVATTATPPPKKPIALASAYRNGTYTGSSADAYYGNVQVQVTISGGKIADVAFLDYPQDRSTSREINSIAMPQLTQEAISAQSARVDGVSGASDTSAAFKQSLASALAQAKA